MKKSRLTILAGCALVAAGINAQTLYEGARLMESDLNGTARFVGMGGAMGALGGDISTIRTNPAGIGIYRSNDFMVSFGFNNTEAQSQFNGTKTNVNRFRGSFDNVGFVYSNKISNVGALKFVNFGFNYQKKKNFNRNFAMSGDLNGLSQTSQMAFSTDGIWYETAQGIMKKPNNYYEDINVGWLSILGLGGGLVNYDRSDVTTQPNGHPMNTTDANGNPLYSAYDYYVGTPGKNAQYNSRQWGGINQYDFNVSFNVIDQVYLGLSMGIYDMSYTSSSYYSEQLQNGSYTLENWFRSSGAGVDFKLGMIVRPSLSLPLRLGVAVHTPTWYNMKDVHSASITSNAGLGPKFIDTSDAGDALREYRVMTPWKFNFSMGYTIGSSVAIGAEYEYQDYSSVKFRDIDGYQIGALEDYAKSFLKKVHTARFGIEAKLVPSFSVRAGYNFTSAAFDKGAYKDIPNTSTRTDTEFENTGSINNFTLGMGYRGRMFYADIAYQYSMHKSDFYAFNATELPATKVDNNRQQVLMTLGVRF